MHIFLWLYTIFLLIIWWVFIVTKIHAYKFKNLSDNIELATKGFLIILIILSLIWYWVIIYIFNSWKNIEFNFRESDFYFNNVDY